ncbi:hypothetical protein [Micromonospora sp. NPDC001898]
MDTMSFCLSIAADAANLLTAVAVLVIELRNRRRRDGGHRS